RCALTTPSDTPATSTPRSRIAAFMRDLLRGARRSESCASSVPPTAADGPTSGGEPPSAALSTDVTATVGAPADPTPPVPTPAVPPDPTPATDVDMTAIARFIDAMAQIPHPVVVELGTRRQPGQGPTCHSVWVPHAASYIGVDYEPGEDVDVVADAHELSRHL